MAIYCSSTINTLGDIEWNCSDDCGISCYNCGGDYSGIGNLIQYGFASGIVGCTDGSACNYNPCAENLAVSCYYGINDNFGTRCDYGPANCFDGNACARDSITGNCLYPNCDGSCTSTVSVPDCCPDASNVLSGIAYNCGGTSYTGTLTATASAGVNIGSLIGLPSFITL